MTLQTALTVRDFATMADTTALRRARNALIAELNRNPANAETIFDALQEIDHTIRTRN